MVAATCTFAYWKLDDILSRMAHSRYGMMVDAVKGGIEDRSAMGLPLFRQGDVQDRLDRYRSTDSRILEIAVFNADGEILFDSDHDALGLQVPKDWLRMVTDPSWSHDDLADDESRIVGAPITEAFGRPAGGVVLRYPISYLKGSFGPVFDGLAVDAALVAAVFGGIAVLGAGVLLTPFGVRLKAMGARMMDRMAYDDGEAPPVPDPLDATFEGCFDGFEWQVWDAVGHLQAALDEVERLDRLA